MPFELPDLPFAKDALAPHISAETIEYHYGKHHRAYVDKLNGLIAGTEWEGKALEDVVRKASGGVFNNGAQAWNHAFYWKCLKPAGGAPGGSLSDAITSAFGSVDALKEKFTAAAAGQFGSGWAWLVKNPAGTLEVTATPNADNPMRGGATPLLTCDVWEHAYYIDYRNARPKYLEAFWNLINWDFVAANLAG
jgi:superoxide dismutase, Fe-Mn family